MCRGAYSTTALSGKGTLEGEKMSGRGWPGKLVVTRPGSGILGGGGGGPVGCILGVSKSVEACVSLRVVRVRCGTGRCPTALSDVRARVRFGSGGG